MFVYSTHVLKKLFADRCTVCYEDNTNDEKTALPCAIALCMTSIALNVLSMLQQQTLLSAANMEVAEQTILDFPLASSTATDNSWLVDFFLSNAIDDGLPNPDLVIIYYVSRYIACSVT